MTYFEKVFNVLVEVSVSTSVYMLVKMTSLYNI